MASEIKGFYERTKKVLLKVNVCVGGVWQLVDLLEELSLGDEYDNPWAIAKYIDEFATRYANWAILLLEAENFLEKAQENFDDWVYLKESVVEAEIIQDRNNSTMAAGLKKAPTAAVVRAEVKKRYAGEWAAMAKKVSDQKALRDPLKIVVDAFKIKQYTMGGATGLIKSLYEQKMLDIDKGTRKVLK